MAVCHVKSDEIKEISNKNKFYLIEDAAESFGASLNGRKNWFFWRCFHF